MNKIYNFDSEINFEDDIAFEDFGICFNFNDNVIFNDNITFNGRYIILKENNLQTQINIIMLNELNYIKDNEIKNTKYKKINKGWNKNQASFTGLYGLK